MKGLRGTKMEKINFNPIVKWIKRRILKNKNCIIIINGATGSGKTYAAIDLALQLSNDLETNFTIENNMAFHFSDLLLKTKLKGNDKPGTVFVFEEVGSTQSGSSSREWQSKGNIFFFSFMQTSRHKRQILIMTCPNFHYLEKGARELVHMQVSMVGMNQGAKESYGKPFILQVDPVRGKIYMKYLRFTFEGRKTAFKKMTFNLPPPDILETYENYKTKFTSGLEKMIIDKTRAKEKNKPKITSEDVLALRKTGLTQQQTAKKLSVSLRTVQNYEYRLKEAEKKLIKKAVSIPHPGLLNL